MKIFLLLLLSFGTSAQILTIPTGTNVQSNTTSDQVTVNGYLRVTGSLTRGLMIEKDNDDSWVTFHDPNDYWYSMGIDRSNSGNFALNAGGTVGSSNHFVMTGGGKIGIGVSNPQNTMQVFAGNGGASDGLSIYGTNGTSPKLFLAGDAANSIAATLSYNSSSGNLDIAPRAGYNTLFTSGKVGIGGAPKALFDVSSYIPGGTLGSVLGRLQEGDGTGEGTFLGVRGYYTQPTNVKSFAIEHSFWGAVNSSINFSRGVGATGGFIAFNTNDNTEQMRITTSGNVGIGTTTPGSFKLAVEGKIYGKEVQVAINNPGPDYVFEKDYNLPSLDSIKTYIDQNKHLPEVPSAKEMEANRVNLGEMNMLLLKKVEELTLYMMEANKKISSLESRLNNFEKQK